MLAVHESFFFSSPMKLLVLPPVLAASIPSKSEVLGCLKKAPWKSFQSEKFISLKSYLPLFFFFAAFFFTTCLWFFGGSARNQYGIISFNMDFSHSHVKAWSPNAATLGENGENRANNDTCSSHAPKEICFKKTSINHHVQLSTKNLKKKKKSVKLTWQSKCSSI